MMWMKNSDVVGDPRGVTNDRYLLYPSGEPRLPSSLLSHVLYDFAFRAWEVAWTYDIMIKKKAKDVNLGGRKGVACWGVA